LWLDQSGNTTRTTLTRSVVNHKGSLGGDKKAVANKKRGKKTNSIVSLDQVNQGRRSRRVQSRTFVRCWGGRKYSVEKSQTGNDWSATSKGRSVGKRAFSVKRWRGSLDLSTAENVKVPRCGHERRIESKGLCTIVKRRALGARAAKVNQRDEGHGVPHKKGKDGSGGDKNINGSTLGSRTNKFNPGKLRM